MLPARRTGAGLERDGDTARPLMDDFMHLFASMYDGRRASSPATDTCTCAVGVNSELHKCGFPHISRYTTPQSIAIPVCIQDPYMMYVYRGNAPTRPLANASCKLGTQGIPLGF